MGTRRLVQAWPWLYAALAVIGAAMLGAGSPDLHWTSYLELLWGLVLLSVCGFIAMTGIAAARWLVRISAVAVAGWYLLMLTIVQSNAPHYGGTDWVVVSILVGVIASAVVSFVVTLVRPNSALVSDTYSSPLRAQNGAAQRGR